MYEKWINRGKNSKKPFSSVKIFLKWKLLSKNNYETLSTLHNRIIDIHQFIYLCKPQLSYLNKCIFMYWVYIEIYKYILYMIYMIFWSFYELDVSNIAFLKVEASRRINTNLWILTTENESSQTRIHEARLNIHSFYVILYVYT